ncbi:MAG: cache domain-containing protein, partial [Anaerolineae bacterium]
MKRLLAHLSNWRLQHILIIGFALTTAITIIVGSLMTSGVINNYLEEAQDARVGRDMDLANAFYNTKLNDISATARRLATSPVVSSNIVSAGQADEAAVQALKAQVDNEVFSLPPGSQRFIVITDAEGKGITGCAAARGQSDSITCQTDWATLPIVRSILAQGEPQAATEVIPAEVLAWVGLEEQARISLIDTPKAAQEPFEPLAGTAGLVLVGGAPVLSEEQQIIGSVLVGHLFNKDFTLVDRIKEVAGVDTATIFFGDLRVSTNVEDELGNRAIGTRVSQEVFDRVLVEGKEFTGPAYVVNQWYITRYQPLYDHLGGIVGMLYVGAKQAGFQRLVDTFRSEVFLIAAATLLVAILIAIPLSLSISRPFTDLAAATRKVAQGDWSARVPVDGFQEMHTQAESFNTMVETLQVTQDQLIQQEKLASVGQLAAGVAHEINNPLSSILLYADILCQEISTQNAQQYQDLQMIMKEAKRCRIIVNDLLSFSRQNEVMAQPTDLNALLEEIAEEIGIHERFQGVGIQMDLDSELPLIEADPFQLRQVFCNLMNN